MMVNHIVSIFYSIDANLAVNITVIFMRLVEHFFSKSHKNFLFVKLVQMVSSFVDIIFNLSWLFGSFRSSYVDVFIKKPILRKKIDIGFKRSLK